MRRPLVEDDDGINTPQRGKNLGAFCFRCNWPPGSTVGTDRSIRIDADDERISKRSGVLKVAHVTRMQQIEDAVCEYDDPALAPEPLDEVDRLLERQGKPLAHRHSVVSFVLLAANLTFDENIHR